MPLPLKYGLKSSIILLKLLCLWLCEIWSSFMKVLYFVNNYLIKVCIKKAFAHMIVNNRRTPQFVSS